MPELDKKYQRLTEILCSFKTLLVAFSGGVDSTLLLATAAKVMQDKVEALTIDTLFHSRKEIKEAKEIAAHLLVKQTIISPPKEIFQLVKDNSPDRCYICKKAIFSLCADYADKKSFQAIVDGSNLDDLKDYRPGRRALEELAVRSPLCEAQLTKMEIRELSRRMGLPTADKPALACLLTRFPTNSTITEAKLKMVEAAEDFLSLKGFNGARVRDHQDIARIEFSEDVIEKAMQSEIRREIALQLHKIGYRYITIDVEGYKMGSMNVM